MSDIDVANFADDNRPCMSAKIAKSLANPFQANVLFLYPLTFSGGIEREHWPEMR